MRRFLKFGAAALFLSAMAFADTFSGALLDANCDQQQQGATCTANQTTTAFAIQSSGKILKLDAAGNRKAADALKATGNNSADRAKDPNAPGSQVMATVQGTLSGDTIQVDSVQVR